MNFVGSSFALAVMTALAVVTLPAHASNSIEGVLEVEVVDYLPSEDEGAAAHDQSGAAAQDGEHQQGYAEYHYRLQRDDGSEVILQGEDALAGYTSGERVAVQGRMVSAAGAPGPDRMAVRSVERLEDSGDGVARQGVAEDHDSDGIEKRRVLGIVVDFKDSDTGISRDDARNAINEADEYFRLASGGTADGSGGQLGFVPPSSGPAVVHVDLDINANGCDYRGWSDAAKDAAKAQGVDFSPHQHTVYFLPRGPTSSCGWDGRGELGCSDCTAWVRGWSAETTGHELGHNLGMHHSSARSEATGNRDEYGERTLMGSFYAFLNPPHRDFLGWYDEHPDGLAVVEAGEETVTIAGISGLNADWAEPHPHGVKVPIGDSDHAYYAYQLDEDPGGSTFGWELDFNLVVITRTDPDRGPMGSMQREILGEGESFHDAEHGIRFTIEDISRNPIEATLRVENGDDLVAEDVAWTMAPGQTHKGTLEASKPNGTEPSFSKISGSDQGQASLSGDGRFTYTAHSDAEGSDAFTFKASTGNQSAEGEAKITFNQTPEVKPLELSVDAGAATEGTLPASDAESEIRDLALTVTKPPRQGALDGPKDDGSFTYTANEGSSGTDTFRYTAGDAYSESEPAAVTVTIEADGDGDSGGDDSGGDDSGGDDAGGGDSGGGDSGGSNSGSSDSGSSDSGGSDEGGSGGGALSAPWVLLLGLVALFSAARRRRLPQQY